MNIEIELLKKSRLDLEKKYNLIDREINKLYLDNKKEEAFEKEGIQKLIDLQLIYIDKIIADMMEIPKTYNDYLNVKKKYEELVGE